MPKALIWGESLVGSGHARIQSELSRQLRAAGWEVMCVTSSKAHTDNFDFGGAAMVYQPPLRLKNQDADPYNMAKLITPSGKTLSTDGAYRSQRRDRLLELYRACRPDAVITEMWPYARANFDFELIPLAEAIKAEELAGQEHPRLYSIARDIMFPPRLSSPDSPNLNNDRHALAAAYFKPASILVRGDQAVIPLDFSAGQLPEAARGLIEYVGYFVGAMPPRDAAGAAAQGDVLVSSGGGVTRDSLELFAKAIEARRHTALRERTWRIIVPHGCSQDAFDELARAARAEDAGGGILVERNRRDFLTLLANAALLVCHAGNTVVEAVTAHVPVFVVPRGLSKNNLEQRVRAKAFHAKGLIGLADFDDIRDPAAFAAMLDATARTPPPPCPIMTGGAARMAQRIAQDHRHRHDALEICDVAHLPHTGPVFEWAV